MHKVFTDLVTKLESLKKALHDHIPNDDPFGNAHGNWQYTGLSRPELISEVDYILDLISQVTGDVESTNAALLNDYGRRLEFLRDQTAPNIWGNAGVAVSAFALTLNGLKSALNPTLNHDPIRASAAEVRSLQKKL